MQIKIRSDFNFANKIDTIVHKSDVQPGEGGRNKMLELFYQQLGAEIFNLYLSTTMYVYFMNMNAVSETGVVYA